MGSTSESGIRCKSAFLVGRLPVGTDEEVRGVVELGATSYFVCTRAPSLMRLDRLVARLLGRPLCCLGSVCSNGRPSYTAVQLPEELMLSKPTPPWPQTHEPASPGPAEYAKRLNDKAKYEENEDSQMQETF